ncbi:MAG: dihydroorotate dehydrogenase [Deltaproteobacteria bacterium]|nr:dihydroorotate dehydrogenase [Deltaproteobacteria bacterium]
MEDSRRRDAVDLTSRLGPLELRNPVIAASGTFGYGEEYASYLDLSALGAVAVKGLSLEPRAGNPVPRIVETRAGMLNAIGLQNVGVRAFEAEKMPWLREVGVPVIVNFFGSTVDEYVACARKVGRIEGVAALEMNISCPNVKAGGIAFGVVPELARSVVAAVRRATDLPLIVKLSPNVTDIRPLARAAAEAGADALALINTLTGMAVDLDRRRPALANVTGGLSGPAIKPVALRMVWEVLQEVDLPVIGIGGILDARDALEFLCLGARAVQVGTANFLKPWVCREIVGGIGDYLRGQRLATLSSFVGTFRAV